MQKCSRQTCEWRRSFVSFSMKKYVNMTKISEIKRWSSGKSKKQCSGNSPDSKIALWKGDITKLQIDAIVNAANKSLLGGGGVDGAIHAAAGPDLLKECKTLNGCETGKSKITKGYKLPSKHVIHTVGPIGENRDLLKSCYENSLNLLRENNLQSIAFPCISTGIFGYPNKAAAKVALKTTSDWLKSNFEYVDLIVFCLFMPVDVKIYNELAEKYFPIKPNDKVPQKQVETLSKTTENGNEPQRTRKSEPDMKNENDPKKVKSDTDVSSSGGKNYSKEGAGSRDKKNKSASNPPVATGEGIGEINADTVDEGLGEDKFRSLEDSHRDKLIVRDTEKWMLNRKDETIFPLLKRVGGLDISYHITDESIACVTAVVLSYPDMKVIYESTSEVQITAPYKAGYLAHRELIPCRDKLKELIGTEHEPQIVLVDGNGMLHHRRFGNASFTGVACDIPTIGVAKNLLFLPEEGIDRDEQHIQNIKKLKKKGDSFDIITKSGELIGKAVITSDNSHKPVYVSTGHRCSLETAVQVSVACSKFRIPEPIRAADKISNTYLRDHYTDDYDAYHKSKQKVSK